MGLHRPAIAQLCGEVIVDAGEAAEFDTMIPHLFQAEGGPAEIISLFDRDGQRAHLHTSAG